MRKLMTAATPSEAVALIGINACVAQTNVQTADVKYDFPVDEIDSDDWTLKQIADTRYDQRSAPTGGKLRILVATVIALATMLAISKMVHAEAPATEYQIAKSIPQYVIPSESIVRLESNNEYGMARLVITRPNGTWVMILMKPGGIDFVAGRRGKRTGKFRPKIFNFGNSHGAK